MTDGAELLPDTYSAELRRPLLWLTAPRWEMVDQPIFPRVDFHAAFDPCVTRNTERSQVLPVMLEVRPIDHRDHVVDEIGQGIAASLNAEQAPWISLSKGQADPIPPRIISPISRRAAVVPLLQDLLRTDGHRG